MYINSKEYVSQPLLSPLGERLYELVGASPASGGATRHSLAHIIVPPGKSSVAHHHLVAEETYFILKGRARMVVDDREFFLEPGQSCLIQPGEVHQIFNPGEADVEFLAVCAPAWVPGDSVYVGRDA